MTTTVLSSKGQVIIPKEVRVQHHWRPGVKFEVVDTLDGILLKPVPAFAPTVLEKGLGCVDYRGLPLADAEIRARLDAAVRRQWQDE